MRDDAKSRFRLGGSGPGYDQFPGTLRQTTAPIVDSGTLPEDPSTVYVVLQSESGTNGTADDVSAYQGILRRAAVARAQGLDLKAIKVTVVNAQGTPLYGAQVPVEETIDPRWYSRRDERVRHRVCGGGCILHEW